MIILFCRIEKETSNYKMLSICNYILNSLANRLK